MIRSSNKIYKETFLRISENSAGFKIQLGEINDPQNFTPDHAILISGENPNILWDVLHSLMGIPYPILHPVEKPKEEMELKTMSPEIADTSAPKVTVQPILKELDPMEEELKNLSAKQIVAKVEKDKGVKITISLKSKSSIIKRALEIYSNSDLAK